MLSLEPFIRVSQKNYVRLAELKKVTMSDSMDQVMEILLNSRFESMAGSQTQDANKTRSSTKNLSIA
jgi:hypothetical protein